MVPACRELTAYGGGVTLPNHLSTTVFKFSREEAGAGVTRRAWPRLGVRKRRLAQIQGEIRRHRDKEPRARASALGGRAERAAGWRTVGEGQRHHEHC